MRIKRYAIKAQLYDTKAVWKRWSCSSWKTMPDFAMDFAGAFPSAWFIG